MASTTPLRANKMTLTAASFPAVLTNGVSCKG